MLDARLVVFRDVEGQRCLAWWLHGGGLAKLGGRACLVWLLVGPSWRQWALGRVDLVHHCLRFVVFKLQFNVVWWWEGSRVFVIDSGQFVSVWAPLRGAPATRRTRATGNSIIIITLHMGKPIINASYMF